MTLWLHEAYIPPAALKEVGPFAWPARNDTVPALVKCLRETTVSAREAYTPYRQKTKQLMWLL